MDAYEELTPECVGRNWTDQGEIERTSSWRAWNNCQQVKNGLDSFYCPREFMDWGQWYLIVVNANLRMKLKR